MSKALQVEFQGEYDHTRSMTELLTASAQPRHRHGTDALKEMSKAWSRPIGCTDKNPKLTAI